MNNKTTPKSQSESKSKSKFIRFSEPLYNQLAEAAEQSGKSFNTVVVECLTQASPVVVTEGDSISGLLFDISNNLGTEGMTRTAAKRLEATVEELADLICKLREKYLIGGVPNGNPEKH